MIDVIRLGKSVLTGFGAYTIGGLFGLDAPALGLIAAGVNYFGENSFPTVLRYARNAALGMGAYGAANMLGAGSVAPVWGVGAGAADYMSYTRRSRAQGRSGD